MTTKQIRDLTFIAINPHQSLVIACDSSGSIGNKSKDSVRVSPETVGYFTAHVALSEILAVGAQPISLINTLTVEMTPTGEEILRGIKLALETGNLKDDIMVTGSTEENFPTVMTGVGMTVIGLVDHQNWCQPKSMAGDLLVVVGQPKIGSDVKKNDPEILDIGRVKALRQLSCVHEIVPVGSKGIHYEVDQIGKYSGLTYYINKTHAMAINQSAGPATCAVVTVDPSGYDLVRHELRLPVHKIGELL